ncbi:MAG: response regulator, partial [Myxococcota bacterium]
PAQAPVQGSERFALVLTAAGTSRAFLVDDVEDENEAIVRELGPWLEHAPLVSSATVGGEGEIIPILNPVDLVRWSTQESGEPVALPEPERKEYRALVVDDSATTRTLEKSLLEAEGFTVFTATDGEEAWALLQDRGAFVDIVISDVEMPNLNGLELIRRIRAAPSLKDLPFILLSSLASAADRAAGIDAGANGYLVKGDFEQERWLETIRSTIG